MNIKLDPAEVQYLDRLINEPMYWHDVMNHKSGDEVWSRTTEVEGFVIDFKVCTPLVSSYGDDPNSTCWCEAVVFERAEDDVLHEIYAEIGDHIVGEWGFDIDGKSFSVEVA